MAARDRILAEVQLRRSIGFDPAWDQLHGNGGLNNGVWSAPLANAAARFIDRDVPIRDGWDRLKSYALAGAMIAAEIDRLNGSTLEGDGLPMIESAVAALRGSLDTRSVDRLSKDELRDACYCYTHLTDKTARWPNRLSRETQLGRTAELALAGAHVYLELERLERL